MLLCTCIAPKAAMENLYDCFFITINCDDLPRLTENTARTTPRDNKEDINLTPIETQGLHIFSILFFAAYAVCCCVTI